MAGAVGIGLLGSSPAPTAVLITDRAGSVTATVGSIQAAATIIPLPANATFVSVATSGPGSDVGNGSGTFALSATERTTASQKGCTTMTPSGTFGGSTSLPYLELQLQSDRSVALVTPSHEAAGRSLPGQNGSRA